MAKGRKLTTSRSERFLGSYSFGHGQGGTGTDVPELGEDDIWSVVDDITDRNEQIPARFYGEWDSRADAESYGGTTEGSGWSRKRIAPRDRRNVGGLSTAFEDSYGGVKTASPRIVHQLRGNERGAGGGGVASPRHMATSAPVNVPDWSKILRVGSVESMHDSDDGLDDRDTEMVPPHEYLARAYARSQKNGSASVFEGVGRTLKGRDMRRVRDAVWSQTGFDG